MWKAASKVVNAVFFKDTVELYELSFSDDDIGETQEVLSLVGEYICNIENAQSAVTSDVSGQAMRHAIRISTVKEIPLDCAKTYKVKIKSARIAFDPNDEWLVDGWTEAQISTVIAASKEVAV